MKPKKGKISYREDLNLGYVHQNPMIHFRQETVQEEFQEVSLEDHLPTEKKREVKLFKSIKSRDSNSVTKNPASEESFDLKRSFHSKNNSSLSEDEKMELIKLFELSNLLVKHP